MQKNFEYLKQKIGNIIKRYRNDESYLINQDHLFAGNINFSIKQYFQV